MQSRHVSPEALDSLPWQDPAALRARLDLQTLHRAMGTQRILRHTLARMRFVWSETRPLRVLELGAGDGSLLLALSRTLAPAWPAVELTLLDRQPLLSQATVRAYGERGWNAVASVGDVSDWAQLQPDPGHTGAPAWDLVLSNLFLHHFEDAALRDLLAAISASTDHFVAVEPRRAPLAWAGSHLVALLGVNSVTRKDAVLSVQAGFRAHELSALWTAGSSDWRLLETRAGLFSHCFCAQRQGQYA
jgi:predicted nicotinamide N-methyase